MCYRLLAALDPPPPPGVVEPMAFSAGLDVRVAARGEGRFLEIAWGDCACSLYSLSEGRARAVSFVEALASSGRRVQLLLSQDEADLPRGDETPAVLLWDEFRAEGLAALPEGRVVELPALQ